MKTLKDYPVTFPYGTTSPPYSKARPHRGNDRACPINTPVVIDGTTIGLAGKTGAASGVHCHTQAGTDPETQKTVDPTPHEFKPGVVTALRTANEGEWGKYVRIQNRDGMYVTYAHLNEVNVRVGQVIGGNIMPNEGDVHNAYLQANGRKAMSEEVKIYTSKPWNAPDGLYYGKIKPDFDNTKAALASANPTEANRKLEQISQILGLEK